MRPRQLIAEGKTKVIWQHPDHSNMVMVASKDNITAGDGAWGDVIDGKAEIATTTAVNCFKLLTGHGVPTHFVYQESPVAFMAHLVDMIPLEVVVRRVAMGSYVKRCPWVKAGTTLAEVSYELFYKRDDMHDPYVMPIVRDGVVVFDLFDAAEPLSASSRIDLYEGPLYSTLEPVQLAQMRQLVTQAFTVLEGAFARQGVALLDCKFECGFSLATQELVIADVVDNDSWRIRVVSEPGLVLDKDAYRKLSDTLSPEVRATALEQIRVNYQRVADITGKF